MGKCRDGYGWSDALGFSKSIEFVHVSFMKREEKRKWRGTSAC
jgi:hypothetical protein